MDVSGKIVGMEEAIKAMQAAFPADPKAQEKVLVPAMRRSANKTMVPEIKAKAMEGDGSGALAESIGIRKKSRRAITNTRTVAAVEIAPIRSNMKAMAMYVNYYYTARGQTVPSKVLLGGIRHGHFVEFGSVNNDPRSFLWEPVKGRIAPYTQALAAEIRRQVSKNLRRAAAKNRSKSRGGRTR
jgi:hypothetical protein